MGNYGEICENMGKYGKIWGIMGKYVNICENMGKYGEIMENNVFKELISSGNTFSNVPEGAGGGGRRRRREVGIRPAPSRDPSRGQKRGARVRGGAGRASGADPPGMGK